MAAKRGIALAAVMLLALAFIGAEGEPAAQGEAEPATSAGPADEAAKPYFYTLGEDGQPVFTQILSWEADPNALEYEVLVRAGGAAIVDDRTPAAKEELHLPPGDYEYKIVTYNLLGQAEAETEWLAITVIKAEQPVLAESSPATIYMDALDGRIAIKGEKLLGKGVVKLLPKDGRAASVGKVVQSKGEGEIVVAFPDKAYAPGEYAISFENPGGLSASIEDALKIRFQRPFDLLVSLGYSPYCSLYDDWFLANWPSTFKPLGFDANIGIFFIKQRWGFIGIEVGAEWRHMTGGEEKAVLTSDYVLYGADALYKYRFTRQLHGLFRLGGGFAWSWHSFDYEGFAGPTTESYDPFMRVGLALQAFLPFKLYGEIGADWSCLSLLDHLAGGITPRLTVGYQLY